MGYAYEHHVPSRAEIVVGMLADAIRRYRDRRDLLQFMQKSPADADRIARDLHVDKATLLGITGEGRGPPILLNRRLRQLGIDPEELRKRDPAVSQDLARCCALCSSKTRCARDFARKPETPDWRAYCLNAPTLDVLRPSPTEAAAVM